MTHPLRKQSCISHSFLCQLQYFGGRRIRWATLYTANIRPKNRIIWKLAIQINMFYSPFPYASTPPFFKVVDIPILTQASPRCLDGWPNLQRASSSDILLPSLPLLLDEDDELFNSWLAKASISNALASWSGRIVAAATRNVDDNACRRFRREWLELMLLSTSCGGLKGLFIDKPLLHETTKATAIIKRQILDLQDLILSL